MSEDTLKNVNDSFLPDQGYSPTAATASNRLYGPSGAMSYRVTVQGGAGVMQLDIVADSGDDAAENAHKRIMGGKVLHIAPTPQNELIAS